MADTHSVMTRQVPGPTAANAPNDAQRHEDSEQTSIEIIMLERYQAEIIFGVNQYARWLVPESHNRIPITWRTFPNTLAYFIPLIFMAYLARRPNTHIIRLLLLPTLLTTSLRSCFGYMWTDPKMNVYNWGEGLICLVAMAKGIEYALVRNGRFKKGEKNPGDTQRPAISMKDYDPKSHHRQNGHKANGHKKLPVTGLNRPGSSVLPLWLQDSLELICAFRGVGWDFGEGVYIPPETKPLARNAFLKATFWSFLQSFFLLDFMESTIKLVPGVGSPNGGSIFFSSLPPAQRFAFSTFLCFLSGSCILTGFQMCYDLATLFGVGLLKHDPTSWPPVVDNPWISTSLTQFWARRWHQLLRQTFLVYGGYPGQAIAGRVGLVLGTFLASGLYHEFACIAMGREWDNTVVAFFLLQGILVLLEGLYKSATGSKIDGWIGTFWVYFVIMILSQPCVDSWHRRGLGGGLVIPPIISPTRRIFFPLFSWLLSNSNLDSRQL